MRIALYARKSTEQEERQVQSLEDQISVLTSVAARDGLFVSEIFQEARSAKAPDVRPEFARLLAEVEAGRIDGILTWSMDRLARNPVDGGRIAYALQSGKLSLIRTPERSYKPEENALLLSIENGMATAYIQDLRRNVIRGMKGKIDRGWHVHRAPVGYRNNLETKEIDVDRHRFALMRHGWDLLLSGEYSLLDVHRVLVSKGLSAYERGRRSRPISRSAMYRLFQNKFYAGLIQYRGQWFEGKHKPMISQSEFTAAQEIIKRGGNLMRTTRTHAYSGTFRCAACGSAIVGESRVKHYRTTNRTVVYTYYHCTALKGCSKAGVREDMLTDALDSFLSQIAVSPQVGAWVEQVLEERLGGNGQAAASAAAQLDQSIQSHKAQISELVLMRARGEIGPDELQAAKQRAVTELNKLEDSVRQLREVPARVRAAAMKEVDLAIQAGLLKGGFGDPFAIGALARACGIHRLDGSKITFEVSPAIKKLVEFEPRESSSQSLKTDELTASMSSWLSLVEQSLNLSDVASPHRIATIVQPLIRPVSNRRRKGKVHGKGRGLGLERILTKGAR